MRTYTKKVASYAQYAQMRGVTDFTNAAQFNLYESGYGHLFVIDMPHYINVLCKSGSTDAITRAADKDLKVLRDSFKHILEHEFKSLSGIDDVTADTLEITDGISQMNVIGKVNQQSAAEISMNFTEKSGSIITNFISYYLKGIKDPRTQAKTYHGLIKNGELAGGFENEVFNLLYVVTDNTMLQLEKAYLLCNAWPTKASTSIYEYEKGSIDKKDIDVTWQCFLLDGPDVDLRALKILARYNEQYAVARATKKTEIEAGYTGGGEGYTATKSLQSVKNDQTIHLEADGGHYAKDYQEPHFQYQVLNNTTPGEEGDIDGRGKAPLRTNINKMADGKD